MTAREPLRHREILNRVLDGHMVIDERNYVYKFEDDELLARELSDSNDSWENTDITFLWDQVLRVQTKARKALEAWEGEQKDD